MRSTLPAACYRADGNDVAQEDDYLKGSIGQVTAAIKNSSMSESSHRPAVHDPHYPERQEQIERFAKKRCRR